MTLTEYDDLTDVDRAIYQAAWEREQGKCSCGRPLAKCSDPHRSWYPQRIVCYADAERLRAQRIFDALHEKTPFHDGTFRVWAKEYSRATPSRYDDGVVIVVTSTDLSPNDTFLESRTQPMPAIPGTPDDPDEEVPDGRTP